MNPDLETLRTEHRRAAMTGGAAFVQAGADLTARCNGEMVGLAEVSEEDRTLLVGLLADHARLTGSRKAADLLAGGAAGSQSFSR